MKVLVTGGAGYIGSVVAAQLLAAGHETTVLDNLTTGDRRAVPDGARLVEKDLLDKDELMKTLAEGFDGVMHLAARSRVEESVAEPVSYYRSNLCGTLNLLDAMKQHNASRIVFSSTAAVYGEPEKVPVEETAPAQPANPYGSSKLAADTVLAYETAATELSATSLRYFNVAGATAEARYGASRESTTQLIPVVLQTAAGRREAVRVYGTDYPTPDGTAIRDFIHVEDIARAHLLALNATEPGQHVVYNLGSGAGFSVRQVIEAARRITGKDIKTVDDPRRAGDPSAVVASSRKIQDSLGWKPEKPDLEDMISDTWNWMRI